MDFPLVAAMTRAPSSLAAARSINPVPADEPSPPDASDHPTASEVAYPSTDDTTIHARHDLSRPAPPRPNPSSSPPTWPAPTPAAKTQAPPPHASRGSIAPPPRPDPVKSTDREADNASDNAVLFLGQSVE